MRSLRPLLLGIALMFGEQNALAEAPELLSYQGVLTLANGTVVPDGLYGLRFTVYNAPSSGSIQFQQTLQVMITDGLYNVMLSNQNGQSLETAFAGSPRYMEVAITAVPVGSGITPGLVLAPRQEIASVPYALVARSAPATAPARSAQAWSASRTRGLSTQNHPDSNSLSVGANGTWQLIPGMTRQITLERTARVHVIANGSMAGERCGVGIRATYDGIPSSADNWGGRYVENSDVNDATAGAYPVYGSWTILDAKDDLTPGVHTVAVEVKPTPLCISVCANQSGAMATGSQCTIVIQAFYD